MIPAQRRGDHRLSLSVAGDPAWLTAHQAGQRLGSSAGLADGKARTALIDNCRLGFVSARAVLMQRSDAGRPGEWSLEEREWDVPAWFWSNFIDLEVEDWNDWSDSPHNWHRGVFAGQGDSPTGGCWVALTGTHFHVEALQALYPSGGATKCYQRYIPRSPTASRWKTSGFLLG